MTSCVRGGFQESSLTHPGTSPRDKNLAGPLWWCLVCCSRRTHLQRRPETFAIRWEAAVLPSKRGKNRGFSVFFSLPTSVGQECASFQLQPKTSCSPTDLGFSRSTIPLREGEPKAEQPSWRYAVSAEITQRFSRRQPQRKDFIQRQRAASCTPCGEKHVENLTAVPLPFFHEGKQRVGMALQAQHTGIASVLAGSPSRSSR